MSPKYNWILKSLVFLGRQTLCRYLSVKCHGLDQLPATKRFIIASNHRSTLDPVLILIFVLPHLKSVVSPAATKGLFVGPLAWLLKLVGSAPIDRTTNRNLSNTRYLIEALQNRPILIFPEGGIVHPPERRKPRQGVAFIAHHAQVPVVPLAMVDTHKALPKGGRWIRKRKVSLRFGQPLHLKSDGTQDNRQFAQQVMQAIDHLETQGH